MPPQMLTAQQVEQVFIDARAQGKRHRDIAEQLLLQEAALIACLAAVTPPVSHDQDHALPIPPAARLWAWPLAPRWLELLSACAAFGPVMALTRNAACVHEIITHHGAMQTSASQPLQVSVRSEHMRLNCDIAHWASAFVVRESAGRPTSDAASGHGAAGPVQSSVQFFDAYGCAVHKIFLRPGDAAHELASNAALVQLVQRFALPAQAQPWQPNATPAATPAPSRRPVSPQDGVALRNAWLAQRDAGEFEAMLTQLQLSRLQALELATQSEEHMAAELEPRALRTMLHEAAAQQIPLLIRVANSGVAQSYYGTLQNIVQRGPWLNVLDPGFNLHVREDLIARAFMVQRPSKYGLCHAFELFDAQDELIASFANGDEPKRCSDAAWAHMVSALTETHGLSVGH